MRIWRGYGAEHSQNLVMIGQFKQQEDAEKTQKIIEQLSTGFSGKADLETPYYRFDDDVQALLRETNVYNLAPYELEQLVYDINVRIIGDKLVLTTEELDVSAFLKLMIENGAKVEIYSAHDYPEAEFGRGK
ncbi:MAG: DUF6375 family protein [Nitrospirota bacterium]|nr:DUF6375 family protein [Nitrospirota bacterium]